MFIKIGNKSFSKEQKLYKSLKKLFGIGNYTIHEICHQLGLHQNIKLKDIKKNKIEELNKFIKINLKTEGLLKKEISQNIKKLTEKKLYRGVRHRANLPVRGQRTKTNARTVKRRKKGLFLKKKKQKKSIKLKTNKK